MNPPVHRLPRPLLSALQLARKRQCAVVARDHLDSIEAAPWDFLDDALQSGEELAAFSPPDGGWEALGIGVCTRVQSRGARRIHEASDTITALRERLVQPSELDALPLLFGGFAFHHEREALSGSWSAWSSLEFTVPALLLYREGDQTRGIVALEVLPEDNEESLSERWCQLQGALRNATARSAARSARGAQRSAHAPVRFDAQGDDDQQSWATLVTDAVQAIRERDLRKVVVARVATAHGDTVIERVAPVMRRLRDVFPRCASFVLRQTEGSCFIGATPELLIATEGDQLRTMALAGTMPRGETPAEDQHNLEALSESDKDQVEHAIVRDEILRALREVGAAVEGPLKQEVVSYSNVHHLCTLIEAQRPESQGLLEFAAALHPTPAVCGTPVARAYEWLAEHEDWERGWYAGAVGWMNANGDGALHVALRSALVFEDRVEAFAGAGIVAASEAAREWDETRAKLRAIISAFEDEGAQPGQETNARIAESAAGANTQSSRATGDVLRSER